jgi:hypothetical protein
LLGSQLTACFTSAPIRASSAAVNSVNAKAVGHMVPSLRVVMGMVLMLAGWSSVLPWLSCEICYS